jgi:hypothetical protein
MTGFAPRTIGLARIRLVETGWLKPPTENWKTDQQRTGTAGAFRTPCFEVVEHDSWAASNPGRCPTGYLSTARGSSAHATSEHAPTEHAGATATVSGPTTATVSGRQVSKALVLSLKEKPKRARSAGALPASGLDFENPKITERIKDFIVWWTKRYLEVYAGTPTISWPREMKRLRPIFERNSNQPIQNAAEGYLSEKSDFTAGHPIGTFVSQFDRWRALGNRTETTDLPDEDDVESDRPADYDETQRKIAEEKARKAQVIAS